MDFVEGTNIDETAAMNSHVKEQLLRALQVLKRGNFVHGDLRPNNLLLSSTYDVRIIDFDWAGEEGIASYPLSLNVATTAWPPGVEPGGKIKAAHDEALISQLTQQ